MKRILFPLLAVLFSVSAVAKTTDLMSWTYVNKGKETGTTDLVGVAWATANSDNAVSSLAFTTPAVKKVKKGGVEYDFAFDAQAWSKRGNANYDIKGNLWAPDVIYNTAMKKWCMYMSVNGDAWYSSIVLLTADNIEGPYTYQAPVVISGFHTGTAYKDTDLEIVLGTQSSLPERYNMKTSGGGNWGERWPNNIDPCVFYDEEGKLWMSYGSWSGGIWMLELDEKTGLRDYDVNYELTGSGNGGRSLLYRVYRRLLFPLCHLWRTGGYWRLSDARVPFREARWPLSGCAEYQCHLPELQAELWLYLQ